MLKKPALLVGGFVLALSLALAGCTFQGDIEHRVVLDDEQGETVHVKEGEAEPQRVMVENREKHERIDLELTVTRASTERTVLVIKVEDSENGEVYHEEEVTIEDESETDGNETDGNETDGNETQESGSSEPEIVVIQNIDVRGKDNFVVANQAIEGDADVEIKAKSSAGAEQDPEEDGNLTYGG